MLTKTGKWIIFILVTIISIVIFILEKGNDTRAGLLILPPACAAFLWLLHDEGDHGHGGYA